MDLHATKWNKQTNRQRNIYRNSTNNDKQQCTGEWKVVIILVGQRYKSTEGWHDYKTSTGTIYRGWWQLIDIGKSNNNFKGGKLKYFNCNKYGYIAKKYWKKKEKEIRKCFKYKQEGHIAKNYKGK